MVSLLCWEIFDAQDASYKEEVLGSGIPRISVEAGRTMGWEKCAATAPDFRMLGLDGFGASAPASIFAEQFGFTQNFYLDWRRSC